VNLSWNADNSPDVTGYNVYRRVGTSGSYARINSSLVPATGYTDTSVTDGLTYFYETTAVNSSGEESSRSAAVQAIIPSP
jgi:fibronectin type 3 domain-containing protein